MSNDRWVEVRRTFTPPAAVKRVTTYGDSKDIDLPYLVMGATVIEYRDSKGRKRPQFVTVIGDQRIIKDDQWG